MSGFIEGENRYQATLFPERLDDYVGEDNAVRVVDVFIDELDLSGLGFNTHAKQTGRPGYSPSTMLKLYVYGYLNRVQSSRRLEREAQRNVELIWLTGRLAPDFKTIADFRKDNGEAIRLVCREFVMLCRKMNLLSEALVAIDGSKFKAVNNRDRNFTRAKMKRRLLAVEASIERYMDQLAKADHEEATSGKTQRLEDKIASMKKEMSRLKKLEVRMLNAPDQQLSLTDRDARSMKARGSGMVGYNVQTAVDTTHHLIVAHEVTNVGIDRRQLASMARQAKAILAPEPSDPLTVVADQGYYRGEELLACANENIVAYVAKTDTSGKRGKGEYARSEFRYVADDDEYECPAGERLIYRFKGEEAGKTLRHYWTSACIGCRLKPQCTPSDYRRVRRWEHEPVVEQAEARVARKPEMMQTRRSTVEHPFGTLKAWMGATHFLTKTLPRTGTEMSLHVLAYNMKRVMRIMGTPSLLHAMRA
ncbi:MAG: IS1182 family transposase [Gammaproteobacteria bacterium]|nr:IS1182 family transposase [Gammaproteobacteria bacterium]